jgi:hypothetical protein
MTVKLLSLLLLLTLMPQIVSAQTSNPRFISSSEARFAPYSLPYGTDVPTLTGEGTAEFVTATTPSPLGGSATRVDIEAKAKGLTFWLKTDVALPAEAKRLSWWVYSRPMPWADVKVVLENPAGEIQSYKAPSLGESPWTRYVVALDALGDASGSLGSNPRPTTGWKFRGLTLGYQPFQKGSISIGEFATSREPLPAALTNSWSLRDVDESITFQSAYTGFNLGYIGEGTSTAVPLPLLLFPARSATLIQWQITTGNGAIADVGQQNLTELRNLPTTDFVLPSLPAANYWARFKLFDAAHQLLGEYTSAYLVHRSDARKFAEIQKSDFDAFWPKLGIVELPLRGPYEAPLNVPLQGARNGDDVDWSWFDGAGRKLGDGSSTVTNASKIELSPPVSLLGQQRFELQLRLKRGAATLDQRTVSLLVRQPTAPLVASQPNPPRNLALRETSTFSLRANQDKLAADFIRHVGETGSETFLSFNWGEIEPAPGFIQYALLDKRLQLASEAKIPVIFTILAHLDHMPRWLWYEQMLNQNGQNEHYSASYIRRPTPIAPRMRAALVRTARELMAHYKDNPQIVGWNFSQGVESFWSDAARNGYIVDYSVTASRQFASYLKAQGWTLADQVTPPRPTFDDGLDLRPIWLAWQAWKQSAPALVFNAMLGPLREADPHRNLYLYAMLGTGDPTAHLQVFKKYNAITCFGGSNSSISPFFESLAQQSGVELEAESSAVPPYEPSLLLALFNKLSHGGTHGGSNVMWGRFFDASNPAHQSSSKAAAQWLNLANRASESRPQLSGLAIGVGMQSLINRTRSFMSLDWNALNAFNFSAMLNQTVDGSAQTGYVTDSTPLDQLQKWPAILWQESPLLDDAAAHRLDAYVRGGGKLILQGRTSTVNHKGENTALLRQLLGAAQGDESVKSLGKGKFQWLSQPIDWQKAEAFRAATTWTGYVPPVSSSEAKVRPALRLSSDGKTRYLFAFAKSWQGGGNPRLEQLGETPLQATMSFNSLPAEEKWTLTDLESGIALGVKSSEELKNGLSLDVKPGLMRMIKLELTQ